MLVAAGRNARTGAASSFTSSPSRGSSHRSTCSRPSGAPLRATPATTGCTWVGARSTAPLPSSWAMSKIWNSQARIAKAYRCRRITRSSTSCCSGRAGSGPGRWSRHAACPRRALCSVPHGWWIAMLWQERRSERRSPRTSRPSAPSSSTSSTWARGRCTSGTSPCSMWLGPRARAPLPDRGRCLQGITSSALSGISASGPCWQWRSTTLIRARGCHAIGCLQWKKCGGAW
mmetsp:Transcript_95774/g.274977  ORF Transcript_95774/g.274977 Transcript_95774/m.274977 type:complete len:231 (+) Transcript_95774:250-942(+)